MVLCQWRPSELHRRHSWWDHGEDCQVSHSGAQPADATSREETIPSQPKIMWVMSATGQVGSFIIMHSINAVSCMCKLYNNTKVSYLSQSVILSPLSLYISSWLHSEKDTEEWFDNRGGQRSWLVQWFGDAGVSWAWILLDIKTVWKPFHCPPPMPTTNLATHCTLTWH